MHSVLYCTVQCIQCTLYTGAGKGNGKFSLVVFAWKDSGNRTIGVALFHKGIFTCVCVAKMRELETFLFAKNFVVEKCEIILDL